MIENSIMKKNISIIRVKNTVYPIALSTNTISGIKQQPDGERLFFLCPCSLIIKQKKKLIIWIFNHCHNKFIIIY